MFINTENMLTKAEARTKLASEWIAALKKPTDNETKRRRAKLAIMMTDDALVLVKALRIMVEAESSLVSPEFRREETIIHDRCDKIFGDAHYLGAQAKSYLL